MEQVNFDYSMKNIGLPSQKEFLKQLIHSVEIFVRNLRWRSFFFLNPSEKPEKETYGFRSIRAAPGVRELEKLEDSLYDLVKNVKFRKYSNSLQRDLKQDKVKIANEPKLIIPADKTSNFYKLEKKDYETLLSKDIQKHYKKADENEVENIKLEHKAIVSNLEIDDRVFATEKSSARVTLKDHKPNFRNKPTTRLINPYKPQIGKISKQFLSRIVGQLRDKTGLSQWKNSDSVISWFKNIPQKEKCSFIVFDVQDYYASISSKLLSDALDWASGIVEISDTEREIILSSKKSLLYHDGTPYRKKSGENFDNTMGAFDSSETSDVVGLFILNELKHLQVTLGLYRDDGLGYSRFRPCRTEKIKQEIARIFEKHGLKVEINANKTVVDFLDVTLDMRNQTFQPYMKPNSEPKYVHKLSNHPPSIRKNIPQSVNDRLCRLSSSKEKFEAAAPPYQEALQRSGYDFKLEYKEETGNTGSRGKRNRTRPRKVTYFNPPFSLNVATNVGKEFLNIIKSFPSNNPLAPIVNTNCIKISYRTLQNMGGDVSRHNSKILNNSDQALPVPTCNCRPSFKPNCPLPGACTITCVVYRALVTNGNDGTTATYTGLTEPPFKKRVAGHKNDIKYHNPGSDGHKAGTRLSRHCGGMKLKGIPYTIEWSILKRTNGAFNPRRNFCQLCCMEKYLIMFNPDDATLNLRSEFFAHCRHKDRHLLAKS